MVTFSVWWIPIVLTVAFLAWAFRRNADSLDAFFSVFCFIPTVWMIFFGLMYFFGK